MKANNNNLPNLRHLLMPLILSATLLVGHQSVMAHGAVEIDQTPDQLLKAYVGDNPLRDSVVMVVPGTQPALMVKHKGDDTLSFLYQGKPWLTFSQLGVFADSKSSNWQSLTEAQKLSATAINDETLKQLNLPNHWKKLSNKPQLTFLEPRLAQASESMTWSVPVLINTTKQQITGQFSWQKIAKVKKTSSSSHH